MHADDAASVSSPLLPSETATASYNSESFDANYDLSQPVSPPSLVQSLTPQNTVGSGIDSGSSSQAIASPYYTQPTSSARGDRLAEPDSVYQLLEGLEPGSPSPTTDATLPASEFPLDNATGSYTSDAPYIARQFPTTGQPIVAPQQPSGNPATNRPVANGAAWSVLCSSL